MREEEDCHWSLLLLLLHFQVYWHPTQWDSNPTPQLASSLNLDKLCEKYSYTSNSKIKQRWLPLKVAVVVLFTFFHRSAMRSVRKIWKDLWSSEFKAHFLGQQKVSPNMWDEVPTDLLFCVFTLLRIREIYHCTTVCWQWRRAALKFLQSIAADFSRGAEVFPIPCFNDVDAQLVPLLRVCISFYLNHWPSSPKEYITHSVAAGGMCQSMLLGEGAFRYVEERGCNCTGICVQLGKCSCPCM